MSKTVSFLRIPLRMGYFFCIPLLFALTARGRADEGDARHPPVLNLVVSDAASFTQAIAAINSDTDGGQYTITLNGSFTNNPIVFTGNAIKTITIKGDASVRAISNNGGDHLFTVPKSITLVLDNNVTLNGDNQNNRIVSVNGGTLVMNSGSTVRGSRGGGVYVWGGGAFTMSGGTISGNSAFSGGGVAVGVGTFTMSGGTINGNSASFGGGVDVSGGKFTMSGGTISGNSASSFDGGGVLVNNGIFAMNNGTFTMSGGTISGNSARDYGGGVYVIGGGTFVKNGGTIDSTNSAQRGGRVAYISNGNKERNAAAGPSVNLDSRVSGSAGGWE